jgi:hypothetical protein
MKHDMLIDFVNGQKRNAWLSDKKIQVYVRKSHRLINGMLVKTFDIANVTAHPKGQGHFTEFLAMAETLGFPVYVESVLNKRLESFLIRKGYEVVPGSNPTCLIKLR